jgi:hypothetical protein
MQGILGHDILPLNLVPPIAVDHHSFCHLLQRKRLVALLLSVWCADQTRVARAMLDQSAAEETSAHLPGSFEGDAVEGSPAAEAAGHARCLRSDPNPASACLVHGNLHPSLGAAQDFEVVLEGLFLTPVEGPGALHGAPPYCLRT